MKSLKRRLEFVIKQELEPDLLIPSYCSLPPKEALSHHVKKPSAYLKEKETQDYQIYWVYS